MPDEDSVGVWVKAAGSSYPDGTADPNAGLLKSLWNAIQVSNDLL